MSTDAITIDTQLDAVDVPEQVSLHARCVIQAWLQHARVAAEKK
jgi:hypothetical protein